jgi:hypothetical protein
MLEILVKVGAGGSCMLLCRHIRKDVGHNT